MLFGTNVTQGGALVKDTAVAAILREMDTAVHRMWQAAAYNTAFVVYGWLAPDAMCCPAGTSPGQVSNVSHVTVTPRQLYGEDVEQMDTKLASMCSFSGALVMLCSLGS
jgi:hypothetical protein